MTSIRGMAICTCLMLSGCAGEQLQETDVHPVFRDPAAQLDASMRLCGYFRDTFEDRNVWPSRAAWRARAAGLGFVSGREEQRSEFHDTDQCLDVTIVRTGCAEETICSWSNFPYAAKLEAENQP